MSNPNPSEIALGSLGVIGIVLGSFSCGSPGMTFVDFFLGLRSGLSLEAIGGLRVAEENMGGVWGL